MKATTGGKATVQIIKRCTGKRPELYAQAPTMGIFVNAGLLDVIVKTAVDQSINQAVQPTVTDGYPPFCLKIKHNQIYLITLNYS